jgi:hypothetical protein
MMKREVQKQSFKLWLLALVLALALTWYTLNPSAAAIQPSKQEDDPPDAKPCQAQVQTADDLCALRMPLTFPPARTRSSSFEESFDWPEYLDLD